MTYFSNIYKQKSSVSYRNDMITYDIFHYLKDFCLILLQIILKYKLNVSDFVEKYKITLNSRKPFNSVIKNFSSTLIYVFSISGFLNIYFKRRIKTHFEVLINNL